MVGEPAAEDSGHADPSGCFADSFTVEDLSPRAEPIAIEVQASR